MSLSQRLETYSYQPGTNKLIHIETTPPIDFGYDLNANITSETGWTYIYDLSNQLIRILQGSNLIAEYTYNGAGQRIKKVAGGTTKIFHYDLWGHLIAETNQSGQMLAEYIYLGDQLLAMIRPGELVYYFHNDHHGTPQVLTDAMGTIVWKATYDPFGEAIIFVQTVENPFRFPGQYFDAETGLHYNYFRYYDPTTGRYITPDPIGLEGGINLFAYVGNPINWTDPFGLEMVSLQTGISVVKKAKGWLGVPYKEGGFSRKGIDCSHLVCIVYEEAELNYPYATSATFGSSQCFEKIKTAPQEGDVILFHGHMGIYTEGKVISAQSGEGKVTLGEIKWFGPVKGYYRYKK